MIPSGKRDFEFLSPRTVQLEPRADLFATATVGAGGRLSIEAIAPIALSKADYTLSDQNGKAVAGASLIEKGVEDERAVHNAIWSSSPPLKLPEHAGVYRLLLHGVTTRGLPVTTSARIVALQPLASVHPRLYFGAADLVTLAARSREPKYAVLWRQIVNRAKTSRTTGDLSRAAAIFPMLGRAHLLPTLPGYFDLITKAGNRIQYNALVAAITGDSEAREAAEAALLDVMKWKSWSPPWFPAHGQPTYYPAGQLTAQVAFAYDAFTDDTLRAKLRWTRVRVISQIKARWVFALAGSRTTPSCCFEPARISITIMPTRDRFCCALGENLALDAGYADYYKDSYYASYFKQAAGHNTALVDGDPASQEIADTLTFPALHEYPTISSVLMSADFDALDSQVQQVYRGRLKQFTRRLVFLKSDYVIVYDELVPAQKASFDWLLHLPDVSRVTTEQNDAIYNGKTASLAVRFLSPAALTLRVTDGHLPYTTFNPTAPQLVPAQPAILNASTAASREPVRFLTVLAPARLPGTAREHVNAWGRIDTKDWMGLERDGPTHNRLLFRKGTATQPGGFDFWATDAAAWFIRGKSDGPQFIAALGATDLKHAGETWFSSKHPASFSASYQGGHVALTVYSAVAQTIQIRKPGGQISRIAVEPGNHEYRVEEGSKL